MRQLLGASRSQRRGPAALRVRARQGARGCRPYEESFAHYAAGNALRNACTRTTPHENAATSSAASSSFHAGVSSPARAGGGVAGPDPIFIVGLPRAGSTLLEQILASHSLVEGTMELPDMPQIARDLAARRAQRRGAFFDAVAALTRASCAPSASATSNDPRAIARPGRRSSSTRCPTTCCTSG